MSKNSSGPNDLECPICNNNYDFVERLPKLLTCKNHHIICFKCVESLIKKDKPTCPFDRLEISNDVNNYQNCSMVQLVGSFFMKKGVRCSNIKQITIELNNELTKLGYNKKANNWLENFIHDFFIKGIIAIDMHLSKFGVKDSERMRKSIKNNEFLRSFNGASKKLIKAEIKNELRNVLNELGYDENEDDEDWIGDFFHDFCSKGMSSVEDYEAKFGDRDAIILKNKLKNNSKIISFVKLIETTPKNVNKKDVCDELEKILFDLDYEKDFWVVDFTQAFTDIYFEALDEFKHKFGVRDATKLKTRIENSSVINLFLEKTNPAQSSTITKREAISELEKLLSDEDYDQIDNPWLTPFIKKFPIQGISAIEEFSFKFGEKDFKKIKNAILKNPKLFAFSNSIGVDLEKDERITPAKATNEIQKIFKDIGYDIYNTDWLTLFLENFNKNGLSCIGFYNSLLGDRDFKVFKRLVFNNKVLQSFNRELFSNKTSPSKTCNINPMAPLNQNFKKPEKDITALVLGATGTGKSSLINLLHLWSKKTGNLKEVKEVLIPTEFLKGTAKTESDNLADQSQTQTQRSAVHRFQLETDQKVYNLSFIDTPGIGDTRGIKRDDENVINILETVSNTAEINCVILMMNGSEPRVSDRIKYIIQRLIGIIPNVVRENLIVLLSNVRFTPNLDVNSIGVNVDKLFYIDNLLFSKNFAKLTGDDVNEEYQTLKNKMTLILEIIETLKLKPTVHFRKIKEKRYEFKNEIDKVLMFLEDKDKLVQAKTRIYVLLIELQSYCSDFNYVKELELTKTLYEARIDYLQDECNKYKNQKDKDELEMALMDKQTITQIMSIMW